MRLAPLSAFALDPAVIHLNHGSFGACPRAVLDAQAAWRARLEAATMRFFVLEYPPALETARAALAAFLRADPAGLAFVPNATTGVATALAALLDGDAVTTDHAYAACRHALDRTAAARGAGVHVARVAFPVRDPGQAVASVLAAVTPATRLVLLDHVTSPTALVLDVAAIVAALAPRGIHVVVDGAHAPGMLDLDLGALARAGVAAYAGNLHKWTCAPKGAGFLWVRDDLRARVRPLVTSHGAAFPEDGRFHAEHDWTGTLDPSAYLSVPIAIEDIGELGEHGGWNAVRLRGHSLALAMRQVMMETLGAREVAAPASMLGTMASIPVTLPAGVEARALERQLLEEGIEVPIVPWQPLGATYVRVSAAVYSGLEDAERVAKRLAALGVKAA